jgi:hypothetical protein
VTLAYKKGLERTSPFFCLEVGGGRVKGSIVASGPERGGQTLGASPSRAAKKAAVTRQN